MMSKFLGLFWVLLQQKFSETQVSHLLTLTMQNAFYLVCWSANIGYGALQANNSKYKPKFWTKRNADQMIIFRDHHIYLSWVGTWVSVPNVTAIHPTVVGDISLKATNVSLKVPSFRSPRVILCEPYASVEAFWVRRRHFSMTKYPNNDPSSHSTVSCSYRRQIFFL